MTRMIPAGRAIHRLKPGSAEWLKLMTGSKIAAVLGLSPWESRFSLWHRMAGSVDPEEQTDEQARGHYLEPAVCQWWSDNHPEYKIRRAPTYIHRHRGWQGASPDRIAVPRDLHDDILRILSIEAKTDASSGDGWGTPGTDEIPVYYRAQGIWTLDVLGLTEVRFPVLTARLEFVEYVVKYDAAEAEYMRAEAVKFLESLRAGEQPDIDEHNATYKIIQQMHPDIDDVKVTLPRDLATRYLRAYADLQDAKADEQLARSEVAAYMGSARYALGADDELVAMRQARGDHPPFVKYAGPKVGHSKGIAA
jgi:putative phage-type endonuclease